MKNPTIRSLASADATYAAALELRAKLRVKRDELEAEENRIRDRISLAKSAPGETAGVAALLGDVVVDDEAPNGTMSRLTEIAREKVDLRRALEISESRVQAARFAASRVIVDEVRPAYDAKVKALAAALVNANSAHDELLSLISALNAQDVVWSGELEPLQATNIFGQNGGKLSTWLQSALRAGFIDQLPREFAE